MSVCRWQGAQDPVCCHQARDLVGRQSPKPFPDRCSKWLSSGLTPLRGHSDVTSLGDTPLLYLFSPQAFLYYCSPHREMPTYLFIYLHFLSVLVVGLGTEQWIPGTWNLAYSLGITGPVSLWGVYTQYILPACVTALAGVIKSCRNTEERRPQPAP